MFWCLPLSVTLGTSRDPEILAGSQTAKVEGVTPGMFSFNSDGGRCDACKGSGTVLIDMQFLADVEVLCDRCEGRRFNDTVLKVRYKGKNVEQILALTVEEAIRFFVDIRIFLRGSTNHGRP